MKATDLLQPDETAIVILTRGLHLDASKPGASTGWWKLRADAQADRVILCHRPTGQREADVYIGDYAGKELRESDGRYGLLLSDCRLMGTTSLPWYEFMDAKPGAAACALFAGLTSDPMQAICFTSSDGYCHYGLVLRTDEPTGMLFVHWDTQHERLADLPQTTRADWQRYGPRQGWVRLDEEQRHGATLKLVNWDELSDDVQGQLRRLGNE